MPDKIKVALIDGLPFDYGANVEVNHIANTDYPWDSDFFGVPEYRRHSDNMIKIIKEVNSAVHIRVYPFYPKFYSMRKNYPLLVASIEKALEDKCHIICICLEVVGSSYLTSEMLRVYKKAYNKKVCLCVSAGNQRPFQNPLIHKKYTIPVIGLYINEQIGKHPNYKIGQALNAVGVYSNCNNAVGSNNSKTSCSRATAVFAGFLSDFLREHHLENNLNEVKHLLKKNTNEENHLITFFNN